MVCSDPTEPRPDSALLAVPSQMQTRTVRGLSPEQAHRMGTVLYYPHQLKIRGSGPRFEMSATATTAGAFTVGTLGYSLPVSVSTGPYENSYQVNLALNGRFSTAAGKQQMEVTTATAAVYRPDVDTGFTGWDSPLRMLTIKIDRARFDRIAEAHLGRELTAPIDFALPLGVQTGPGAAWLDCIRRLVDLSKHEAASELLSAWLEEEAVLGLLWAAEHSFHRDLLGCDPAAKSSLQRAIELIEDLPQEALTLETLSYAAGASGRALQLAFQKELQLSPMQYLKNVRLDRAAQTLAESGPLGPTVVEIARRFGFAHPGRFSTYYAQRHGELPSETRLGTKRQRIGK